MQQGVVWKQRENFTTENEFQIMRGSLNLQMISVDPFQSHGLSTRNCNIVTPES